MKKQMRILGAVALAIAIPVLSDASPVAAGGGGDSCDAIPYIDQGSSATVGGITVGAPVNTANEGPGPMYYLHQPAEMSWTGSDALDTTLTFSPAIEEIVLLTTFHDDGWTGGGERENYQFLAYDSSDVLVREIDITNRDGAFAYSFDRPVAKIVIGYSPRVGVYGSYLRLYLASQANACDVDDAPRSSATVRAPSGWMLIGGTPPALLARAFATNDHGDDLVVSGASCSVFGFPEPDGDWEPVVLDSSTPIGTYLVVCSGGSVADHIIEFYEPGVFRVVASESDLYDVGHQPEVRSWMMLPTESSDLPSTR